MVTLLGAREKKNAKNNNNPNKKETTPLRSCLFFMAASPGFEPRYQHPECRVLPLDDEAIC